MKNEPAFPCSEKRNTSTDPLATPREFNHMGMTLRDYFAGQALIMLGLVNKNTMPKDAAWQAYGIADRMLVEREKSR
jgi:hypothetical protein